MKLERGASCEMDVPAGGGATTFDLDALLLPCALVRQRCGIA
jgi:hypothetical protein